MKAPPSQHERPASAGEYYHQPGTWITLTPKDIEGKKQAPERLFLASDRITRVRVEELPASGRLCRSLRQGGSLQVPGFTDWSGHWIKITSEMR